MNLVCWTLAVAYQANQSFKMFLKYSEKSLFPTTRISEASINVIKFVFFSVANCGFDFFFSQEFDNGEMNAFPNVLEWLPSKEREFLKLFWHFFLCFLFWFVFIVLFYFFIFFTSAEWFWQFSFHEERKIKKGSLSLGYIFCYNYLDDTNR